MLPSGSTAILSSKDMRCVIVKKEKKIKKKKRFNLFRATLKITNVCSDTLEKCCVHIVRRVQADVCICFYFKYFFSIYCFILLCIAL